MNLKDFSKLIGVNPSTISRALNNYPDISKKTKETISKLADKHKYNPSISAQLIGGIKSKSNYKILIADKISDSSFKIFKKNNIKVDKKYNLSERQIISIISNYDGVVVRSSTKITNNIIEKSKNLKIIARAGVGVDNVDVESATKNGVIVMNSPQSTSRTTAEHAISLIFSLARKIPFAHLSTINQKWQKELFKGVEIKSKTVGLIGCGNIGSEVAKIARSLDMHVVVYDPYLSTDRIESLDAEKASLDEVLRISDFVSLHLPIMNSTKNIINFKKIKLMKKSSYLINAARGGLINESDLYQALEKKIISGAALDVFENEPLKKSPLHSLTNIILTPHLGASTAEAQDAASIQISNQISQYLSNGTIINSVNMSSISGSEKKILGPYLDLSYKLGSFAGQLTENAIKAITIEFEGTASIINHDTITRNILSNLLGSFVDNVNSINVLDIAKSRNIKIVTLKNDQPSEYNTLIRLTVTTDRRSRSVAGSIFGGTSRIVEIKGIKIDAELGNFNVYLTNKDKVGVINNVTEILTKNKINIATFNLGRVTPMGEAIALIQTDQLCKEEVLKNLLKIKYVNQVKSILI
jgi:D-3-phosphoglycerate dehydrogenase / 2-oxoglutarate reductase